MEESDLQRPGESLYPPRAVETASYYTDILNSPPESPLDPEIKLAVLEYEKNLMSGRFLGSDGDKLNIGGVEGSLAETENRTRYTNNRCEITLEYFLTEPGRVDLEKLGFELENNDLDSLARAIKRRALDLPDAVLKELQVKTDKYSQDLIAKAIAVGEEIEAPKRIVVFDNVSPLLRRASGLFRYRQYYSEVEKCLRQENPDNEALAEQAILKIYRKKVNALISELEPDLVYMWQQISEMNGITAGILQHSMEIVWPTISKLRLEEGSDSPKRLATRLDRLRNGASLQSGRFSAITKELEKLFEDRSDIEQDRHAAIFSPEERQKLEEIKFDAPQMQVFCKGLLEKLDKLSSEDEHNYDSDRPERAADGKWQVPIQKEISSMGVDDPPGAWSIPAEFNRSIGGVNPPVGVVSGSAHELEHVLQHENIRNNQDSLRFATELGGKGRIIIKEAGAIMAEREVQRALFGQIRGDNPHYLQAFKIIENGGDEIAAARAFYESFLAANPQIPNDEAARIAVSRAKRLARLRGGYNSQPLNYAETALLVEAADKLPDHLRKIIFAEGAYSLEDMAELHRYGLWNSNPELFPTEDFIQYASEKLKELLN